MELCNHPIPNALNGANRGVCTRKKNHTGGRHGSNTCYNCGIPFTSDTASPATVRNKSGLCGACKLDFQRRKYNRTPREYQTPGALFTFSCGCKRILPLDKKSNLFVVCSGKINTCRISNTLRHGSRDARTHGYAAIDPNTPHEKIQRMMENPSCVLCGEPLVWDFGLGKTPHLHHNHTTGEVYGFTHPHCNPQALEKEIDRLRDYIKKLEKANMDHSC